MLLKEGVCYDQCVLLAKFCQPLICFVLYLKFILKLKKAGKNNRPFRYDLKQIPYDYTAEVTDSRD